MKKTFFFIFCLSLWSASLYGEVDPVKAQAHYNLAIEAFSMGDYATAEVEAQQALSFLKEGEEAPQPEPAVTAAVVQPAPSSNGQKPAYYVVRDLSPKMSDSLWRIAGYTFIYNDSYRWSTLYEANKSNLPDPDNPDLIIPGMILYVPSVSGEERWGVWRDGVIESEN